jgi:DNA-binding CsgD family transcriptional regulator
MRDGTPVGGRPARQGPRHRPATHGVAIPRATDREVVVAATVLVAGSEKAAVHRLGLSHSTVKHHLANAQARVGAATTAQLVWILAPRCPSPRAWGRRRSSSEPRGPALDRDA